MERVKKILPHIYEIERYFHDITEKNPNIVFFREEAGFLSQIQIFIPLLDNFLMQHRGYTPLFELQRLSRKLIEEELAKEFPLILPLGFKPENEFHAEFIIQALEYHVKEQLVSMFKIIFRSVISDYDSTRINEKLLDNLFNFFRQINDFEEGIKDNPFFGILEMLDKQMNIKAKLFPHIESFFNFSKPEIFISEYSSTTDVILSFFAKPIYDTLFAEKPESSRKMIARISEDLGD